MWSVQFFSIYLIESFGVFIFIFISFVSRLLIRVSIKSSISMFYSVKLPSFPASSAQPDTSMLYLLAWEAREF